MLPIKYYNKYPWLSYLIITNEAFNSVKNEI